MSRHVRILLDGLTTDATVYRAGDIVQFPNERLQQLAAGELLHGRIVCEFVDAPPPLADAEDPPARKPRK